MKITELITYFEGIKQSKPNSYQCKCPAHGDRKASLSITEKDNKILMKCHAGCTTYSILQEVGLRMTDLYNNQPKKATWKIKLENYKGKKIEAVYQYTDAKGNYKYTKVRFIGKEITYGIYDKEQDMLVLNLNNTPKQLYNLPTLLKAVQNGKTVYFVEGEKDVETLRKFNMTATTCGSVGDWKDEFAKYFKGAEVVILPDNDEVGLKLAESVKKAVKNYAFSVKTVIVSSSTKGDVTDFLTTEKHSISQLHNLIAQTEWTYAPYVFTNSNGNMKINVGLFARTLDDTMKYIVLNKNGVDKELLYIYQNGVYNLCSRTQFKGHMSKYLPDRISNDSLINNTLNYMTYRNPDNIHDFDDINTNESIINLKNGIYNIKTKTLEPHNGKVLSTLQLNCNHISENVNTKKPVKWLKFINELCTNQDGEVDESIKKVLQEYGGLLLSNIQVSKTKKSLILYSPLGNTGKSVFLNIINEIVGSENISNIPMQKLSDRFSLGNIYGKRIISIGDQTAEDILDSSVYKQLTGGDYVNIELKGKQSFTFLFKGGILVACNNLPCFTDDKGGHIFERMIIVPCTNVIPANKRNKNLTNELLEEADGIFNWFLEGLHRLIDNNLTFSESDSIAKTVNDFRNNIDTLYHYISETFEITENKMDRIKKTELEADYTTWCTDNDYKPISKKNIKERASKIGINKTIYCGIDHYTNIKYKEIKKIEQIGKEEQQEINDVFQKQK